MAVAHELKQLRPDIKLVYIGQTGDSLADVASRHQDIDEAYTVQAGKFRRYHSESIIKQILDIPTVLKNIRDFWRALRGLRQARKLLKKIKPDMIFIKGGFVGVPVGLAAARLHIKFITHDSDAIPGLANRIIARWATAHAVALPEKAYNYPLEKTHTVGVPVASNYKYVTPELMKDYREKIKLGQFKHMMFVTGGGLGALRLNIAIAACVPDLLNKYDDLVVVQTAGLQHEDDLREHYKSLLSSSDQKRVIVKGFIDDLYLYSGAADVVVARAGATNIAEFAIQAKACVLVPNPYLTSGHQLKNAEILAKAGAVDIVADNELEDENKLSLAIEKLLDSSQVRKELGEHMHDFARPDSAQELAQLLLNNIS